MSYVLVETDHSLWLEAHDICMPLTLRARLARHMHASYPRIQVMEVLWMLCTLEASERVIEE